MAQRDEDARFDRGFVPRPDRDSAAEREWGAGYGGGYGRSREYGEDGGTGRWGGRDAGGPGGYDDRDRGRPGAPYGSRDEAGPHAGHGPRGYRRSDARIIEDVCELLTRHPELDASDVEVRVQDGEVTLAGTVASRRAKRLAEDLAERCAGVADVHNRLRLGSGRV